MKYLNVEGSNYELGLRAGRALREGILYRMGKYGITDAAVRRHEKEIKDAYALHMRRYPRYMRELKGISDGSGVPYVKILLLNFDEIREALGGCSSIAVNKDGDVALFHNEDGDSWERKEQCALVRFKEGPTTYHFFAYPGELPGCSYNWNSHGLFFSVNYVQHIRIDRKGVFRDFTARKMIEARDLKDAIRILGKNTDASGYHYYIGKGDRIISVEKANDEIDVMEVDGTDCHTNHYIHKKFGKDLGWDRNSIIRLRQVRKLLASGVEPIRILRDKGNKPDSIFAGRGCTLRTLSTVVFKPCMGEVMIYDRDRLEKKFRL
ncbi:MAG TPA: C45 family peptidase [Candidatus Saccharimonadales bacterium]|nr:C45 family peptidase [Candidatus Saccharimonadales bacterium]